MSSAVEMRRVMAHAAKQLENVRNSTSGLSVTDCVALGYARGVFDLLATYLTDNEPPGQLDHLLDNEGAVWRADGSSWRCSDDGDLHTRDEVEALYGPVKEVWLR